MGQLCAWCLLPARPTGRRRGGFKQAFDCVLDRCRGALLDKPVDVGLVDHARLPFAGGVFVPEGVLEAVGDGEAAVLGTLGHDTFRPQVHCKVGPVVVTFAELVPGGLALLLPGAVMGDEAP